MREDFFKILTAKIEQHVDVAFEVRRMMAGFEEKRFARLPYLDDPYEPECETLIPHYQRQVCAALAAREWFRQHAPHWAPELPLSSTDIEKLIRSKSPAIALVGFFAASLAACNWDFKNHPTFQIYAAGVLASPYASDHLKKDLKLLREFPPRELPGLDQGFIWGLSNRTLEFAQQLMRSEEHFRRCGLSEDAKQMRGVIQQITGAKPDKKLADFLDSQPDR